MIRKIKVVQNPKLFQVKLEYNHLEQIAGLCDEAAFFFCDEKTFGSPYDWKYEVYPYKSMKQGGYNASYVYFESCYRRADPSYVKTGGLRLARNAE